MCEHSQIKMCFSFSFHCMYFMKSHGVSQACACQILPPVQYIKYKLWLLSHQLIVFFLTIFPPFVWAFIFLSHQLWSAPTESASPSQGLHKSLLISAWMKRQVQNMNKHPARLDRSRARQHLKRLWSVSRSVYAHTDTRGWFRLQGKQGSVSALLEC